MRLDMRVRGRMLRCEPLAECRDLRLRVLERHSVRGAAAYGDRNAAPGLQARNVRPQWQPHFVRDGECVSLWHHSDDRRETASKLHVASDDLRVSFKASGPHVVAE